eukprot:CAMPEP_0178443146 /NCGR_PEP_ID=MMETSP0689_2-20121128/38682_1 /TAXON_ID=160604 /ORGANISM="Amphidinium massartii, Strain CS-259" /LENGTH=474 /DNA_ID=CAMNT_0020067019 /DNA_START=49 /DNA_END=1470 /DNA_ORIENTATION=-
MTSFARALLGRKLRQQTHVHVAAAFIGVVLVLLSASCGMTFLEVSASTPQRLRGVAASAAAQAASDVAELEERPLQQPEQQQTENSVVANLARSCLGGLTAVALAFLLMPAAAVHARDGTISPPTCVAIINAEKNCPPRESSGALKNAEGMLRGAEEKLRAAEKAAGRSLDYGESENGEPEFARFWSDEVARLKMNRAYLDKTVSQLKESSPLRVVSRLEIESDDVDLEKKFWCEAIGMQTYAKRPDGSVVVAFGSPSYSRSQDEGGYFSVVIKPSTGKADATSAGDTQGSGLKLSHVQVAVPSMLRLSKVVGSGGEILDSYGYNEVKSPTGVVVRTYVEDRRDPVEFLAFGVPAGPAFEEAKAQLEKLGFKNSGSYQKVSPDMQAYMPDLVPGTVFYTGGDPTESPQLVLQPVGGSAAKKSGGGFKLPTLIQDENETFSLAFEEEEEVTVPISVPRAQVVVAVPQGVGGGVSF